MTPNCILTALLTLCLVGSGNCAAPPAVIVCENDGSTAKPGMDLVTATKPWSHRASLLAHYPGVLLKNPMGLAEPMQFRQGSILKALADANPDDKDLQARADFTAFGEAFANRPAKQWLGIYVGGTNTARHEDSSAMTAEEMYAEIAWARAACPDVIGLDATYGRDRNKDNPFSRAMYGPQGEEWKLIKMLNRDGIDVALEPSYKLTAPRLADCWGYCAEPFLDSGRRVGFDGLKAGPFADPHKMPRLFVEYRLNGKTPAEQLDVIRASQEAGEIPVVFRGQVTPEVIQEGLK